MKLLWTPSISLGPFFIGEKFTSCFQGADLEKVNIGNQDVTKLNSYLVFGGRVRIDTDFNELIESITSEESFIFQDTNIIGAQIQLVETLIGSKADEIEDLSDLEPGMKIVDFYDLGLQLVIKNNVVVTATCI